jgi:hypothetical protein
VIIAVIDDLFFSVKIKTAAKTLGTEVYFERTPHQVFTGCANAWNAYQGGRPLKKVNFDHLKGLPEMVA